MASLPPELHAFLTLPGPQTLLIRGPPGSGKSTLSLALLEAFPGAKFLLSSRVSHTALLRGFPWLNGRGGETIEIVDTSGYDGSASEAASTLAQADRLLETTQSESRDFRRFLWLPPALQEAWSRLPQDGVAMVVVDSWDALVERFLGSRTEPHSTQLLDRAEVERLLLQRMGQGRSHLVLVVEREEPTQLDYLVNGIAVTYRERSDGRLERWLSLPKLRGVRIDHTEYPFTLEGARFESILPISVSGEVHAAAPDPDPTPITGSLWPGTTVFAQRFGRLPAGRISLLEYDPELPEAAIQLLTRPMVAHTLVSGGRVLIIPSPGNSPQEMFEQLRGVVPPGECARRTRFLTTQEIPRPDGEWAGTILLSQPEDVPKTGPRFRDGYRFVQDVETPGTVNLNLYWIPGLKACAHAAGFRYDPESFSAIAQQYVHSGSVHAMALGPVGDPLTEALKPVAALHLRLRDRDGRMFVYGVHPRTPGFVLVESPNGGTYDLRRVV